MLLALILFIVGIRAIHTQRIFKGRSLTEHITGPKAVTWGWVYTMIGAGLFLWAVGTVPYLSP
jgi:hypothetical protein